MDLGSYDTVIFASWIHAGKIQQLPWFLSQSLKAATKIVLVTGAAPPDNEETRRTLEANFKDCRQEEYKVFYLQSGLCYEKMGWKDRLMMKVFSKMLDRMKEKDLSLIHIYQIIFLPELHVNTPICSRVYRRS